MKLRTNTDMSEGYSETNVNYCSWCYGDGFVGVVPCRECGSTGLEPIEEKKDKISW